MGLAKVLPDSTIAPMILYDTSMILFCKESRKVSSSQLIELVNFRFFDKPENDTMTLF